VLGLALGIEAVTPYDVVSDAVLQSYVLAMVLGVLIVVLGAAIFALSMLFVQRAPKTGLQRY